MEAHSGQERGRNGSNVRSDKNRNTQIYFDNMDEKSLVCFEENVNVNLYISMTTEKTIC